MRGSFYSKKTTAYGIENLCPSLWQTQKCGGLIRLMGPPFCDDKKCTQNFIQNIFYYGHIYFQEKKCSCFKFFLLLFFLGEGGCFFVFVFVFCFLFVFGFVYYLSIFERHFLRWLKQSIHVQNHKKRKINFLS